MWKNILAVVAGVLTGMIVIGIVEAIGHMVYPLPEGLDPYNTDALKAYMADMPVGALLLVLLAWGSGSFIGGWATAMLASRSIRLFSIIVGVVLLAAGIYNMIMIPHPVWFMILGILIFIPAAYIGSLLVRK